VNGRDFAIPLLHNGIGIMTPFLLAATGGLFSDVAGAFNIALEGLMLIGAFFSVLFVSLTGSLLAGILLGVLASVLASLLLASVAIYCRANIFIAGLATNLFASGLTVTLAFRIFGNKGVVRFPGIPRPPALAIPGFSRIPVLGDVIAGHDVFVYASWAILLLTAVILYKTPFGLRIRGCGLNSEAMISLGLNPKRYKLCGILASGLTCGLAGAMLTLKMGAFVPEITSGRGWIALVAIYLGNRTPLGIFVACIVFGFAESLSNYAQGVIKVPADFILAFPYIVTVIAIIGYSILRHSRSKT